MRVPNLQSNILSGTFWQRKGAENVRIVFKLEVIQNYWENSLGSWYGRSKDRSISGLYFPQGVFQTGRFKLALSLFQILRFGWGKKLWPPQFQDWIMNDKERPAWCGVLFFSSPVACFFGIRGPLFLAFPLSNSAAVFFRHSWIFVRMVFFAEWNAKLEFLIP